MREQTPECTIELDDGITLTHILKTACKAFGCKENYKIAKLYNKNGIQLFKDDIILLAGGDILYLGSKGKSHQSIIRIKGRIFTSVQFWMTTR